LRYSVSEHDEVSATLEVKLAPEIARQFGKQATETVRKADGRLSTTEFTGEDTQPQVSEAGRVQGQTNARIEQLETKLANPALKDGERAQLRGELAELRARSSEAAASIAAANQKLATTPMTFQYLGRGGAAGFAGRNPLREAGQSFVASLVTLVTFGLQAGALILPWAIAFAALWLLWRSRPVRRLRTNLMRREEATENQAP
jgi:hypothetical protein